MADETPKKILYPDLEGVCPCGRKFYVDTQQVAVIHEMPMCEPFKSLELDKYLRYVRRATTGIMDN